MFETNFNDFFGLEHHRCRQSWKSDPKDSILKPKYTHTIWDAFLVVSDSYG